MPKVLLIDGQVFQSGAWDRGMGKYSLAFLGAIMEDASFDYDETRIIFTTNMPLADDVKRLIKQVAPKAKHIMCDLAVPDDPSLAKIPKLQVLNQGTLDALISRSYTDCEIDFMILSLFIDQVCSVFPTACTKIIIIYDLIPLQYSERYSLLTSYNNYLARYKTLFEADVALTISQTVANDVIVNLGISPTKIFNIDGAPIERSRITASKPKVKLPEKYILMPTGNEIRKNNIRAVQGFEAYAESAGDQAIRLVLTSTYDVHSQRELEAYSDRLIFTGNVKEAELRWLYENCEVLLFVPEYEGLGLPILEAADVAKPIVCSNITVFNEMSPDAFYYCDHLDPFDIAGAIEKAVVKSHFATKVKQYPHLREAYTWENTANKALTAIHEQRSVGKPEVKKKRIALLTPSPAGYSAIGKLTLQLHPALQQYFDIDYYIEAGKTHKDFSRPNYLPYIANVYPAEDFSAKKYQSYDAVIYNIGNSEFHVETIKGALYLPGYAIFHDTHLTNIFEGELLTYGYVTQNRLDAEKKLDALIGNKRVSYESSIINNQRAMITHSLYAQTAITDSRIDDGYRFARLNLPTATPRLIARSEQSDQVSIGLAGIIHPAKGLAIIESVAQSKDFANCKINIFGLSLVSEEDIRRLQSYQNVFVATNLTDFQFQTAISQLDILINFRPEYRGETSLATVEAMRFGVVPVVRKIGWYDELPDNVVVKVRSEKDLLHALNDLVVDPARLKAMKAAAIKYVADNHSYEQYAAGISKLVND